MTQAEHAEGGVALLGEAAPVCNGEGLWEAGNARDEVVFPGAYCPFDACPVECTGGTFVALG